MQTIDIRDILKANGQEKRVEITLDAQDCGVGASVTEDADPSACVFDAQIAISASLANVNRMIRAKGSVRASYVTCCARCLKKLRRDIDKRFDEEFVERGSPNESDAVYTYADRQLDLTDAIRDAISLELPIRHLCDESCKSLCPICGADRNNGDCGCEMPAADGFDPRLAVLAGIDE